MHARSGVVRAWVLVALVLGAAAPGSAQERWPAAAIPAGQEAVSLSTEVAVKRPAAGCLGAGGGLTPEFWTVEKNQWFVEAQLPRLRALNLRDDRGRGFDPKKYGDYRKWLKRAAGKEVQNMAYLLSAELAAMHLAVEVGSFTGSALVYAPGTSAADAMGYAHASDLMAEANAELGANGLVTTESSRRGYQEALRTALERANSDVGFVQPACGSGL